MQLEQLKACIETVRKNPKAYLKAHSIELDKHLNEASVQQLLCLLFAATAQDTSAIFEKIDQVVCAHRDFPETIACGYFYEVAKGIQSRSVFSHTKGLTHFIKAYDYAIQLDDTELVARVLLYLSTIFDVLGNREQALRYAKNAIQMVPQIISVTLIGDIYMQYGLMHERQGDLFECLNAYRYAESYYDRCEDRASYLNYCVLIMNAGRNHLKLGHENIGESYIGRALEIAETHEFMVYLHNTIKLISDYYMAKGDYKRANEVLNLFLQSHINASIIKERSTNEQIDITFIDKLNGLHQLYRDNHHLVEELKVLHNTVKDETAYTTEGILQVKDVAEALRRNEFHPYLQAKWDVQTGRITGAEMLARWIKADGRIIGPYEFIGLIENNDLILLFSESMVHKTLKSIAPIIHQIDPHFKVSFNVSPYQLAQQDLVKLLEACCVEYHIASKNIEIEIIERTFIENHPSAIQQLFQLKAKGFGVSLDDFGSGYSSLSCIVELPIDTVKIDRSLIRYIDTNAKSERLFRSIVAMLKALDIAIVAEGIETEAQLSILKACQCDEGQGFLIHKPCLGEVFSTSL